MDNLHTNVVFTLARQIAIGRISFYGGFILVFIAFAFLFKNRLHAWYLVTINLVFSFILLVDIWYFRGFSTMPTLHIIKQGANMENMSESVLAMINKRDIVFVFDIALLIVLLLIGRKSYRNMRRNIAAFAVLFAVSALSIAYMPVKNEFFSGKNKKIIVYAYDSTVTSYNLSPIGYNLYSIYAYWKETKPIKLSSPQRDEIKTWFEKNAEKLPDNKFKSMFAGKNLIVMQIESLENFVINQKINGQEITPNLNRILKNSLYFPNFHEQVNEGMSSDADLIVNTSIYPIRQGATFFRYPATTYTSLPNLMKDKGYYTTAIHADSGSFWNWRVALTNMGYDRCIDASEFAQDETIGLGLSDASYYRQTLPMLKKFEQPFFTFLVTLTNHTPYNLPTHLRELKLDPEMDKTTLGGYLQSINYSDKYIGVFFEDLKKNGLMDNSVIVIFGDHEGVHKYFPQVFQNLKPSDSWMTDNQKEVPFIIYQPELKGEEIKTIGGQVDIVPTIAYMMGVDEKSYIYSTMGRNLLNTNRSFAVLSDGTYVGESESDANRTKDLKGLDLADIIIKGDYFKKKN